MGCPRLLAMALAAWIGSAVASSDPGIPEESDGAAVVAAQIDGFHGLLIEVMRSGSGFEGRAALLAPVIGELFDVPTISRISLGKTWKTLEGSAQSDFSALLEELIVATYADRFDSYNDQTFHHGAAEPARRGWVVKTELEKSDGSRVTMDYYFRDGKVFNVVADGVSDLSLRRADYNSIVKNEGYEQLLAHIRENIVEHRAGDAD